LTILSLIRESEYERPNDVVATEDQLRKVLFWHPAAEVLLGEENGAAVAFALFFHNFSTGWAGKDFISRSFVSRRCAGKDTVAPSVRLAENAQGAIAPNGVGRPRWNGARHPIFTGWVRDPMKGGIFRLKARQIGQLATGV
jgi:hypothetical protein